MRLDKYLCEMGKGTRTEVKALMKKGMVTVNGEKVLRPETKVTEADVVCVDGEPVAYAAFEYFMLNKPAGCVSATRDKHTETVLDLLPEKQRSDLFPVGRLDKDTEGLLLITNDGDLSHRLLSPKKHVPKTYYAKIDGRVTEEHREQFLAGVDIGEEKPCLPAHLEILMSGEQSEIKLTISEGKFHQVKRMFEAVGCQVTYLKRLSMGSLILDENLSPGESRKLTEEELTLLKEYH